MTTKHGGFSHRKNTGRSRRKSCPEGRLTRCLRSLEKLLKQHNHLNAKGVKVAGIKTQVDRKKHLRRVVKDLYKLGLCLETVKGLRTKHVDALVKLWERDGLSPSTIQNRLSHMRTLCRWIDKPGMILSAERYLVEPEKGKREYAAREPKGIVEQDIDILPMLQVVLENEPHAGMVVLLLAAFGLRIEEASKLRPHLADQVTHLAVNWGAKGGRERTVSIETTFQRATLDLAKKIVSVKNHSMIPKGFTYAQWENRFDYVVRRKAGFNTKNGCPPHSFRHSFAVLVYEAISGVPAPVKGGAPKGTVPLDQIRLARHSVAENLGHSRIQASSSYVGAMAECVYDTHSMEYPDKPDTTKTHEDQNTDNSRNQT